MQIKALVKVQDQILNHMEQPLSNQVLRAVPLKVIKTLDQTNKEIIVKENIPTLVHKITRVDIKTTMLTKTRVKPKVIQTMTKTTITITAQVI